MTQHPTDGDPSSRRTRHTGRPNSTASVWLATRIAPLSFVIAGLSVLPVSASGGGVLSAFLELISPQNQGQPSARTFNSQTASILEGSSSVNPTSALGGGDVVVSNGALVPETGPLGTAANILPLAPQGHISVYVVREGDTLSQIANMFSVSVNTILWANEIKNGVIHKGDTLVILPVSGVKYTVKKGDTLASIAKEFDGDAGEIALFNNLEVSAALAVGTEVIIPGGEAEEEVKIHVFAGEATKYYTRPISGGVKTQGVHGYNAVDLATYAGAPVYAAASGKVLISREGGWNGGYGNYIVIEHDNGTQTLYAHNSDNLVVAGEWVVKGQTIGHVGSTGRSTGPHVHFEVRGASNPF